MHSMFAFHVESDAAQSHDGARMGDAFRRATVFAIAALAMDAGIAFGRQPAFDTEADLQATSPRPSDPNAVSKHWRDVIGKNVRVEGIAWDDGKGPGDCVFLDGTVVYCQRTDFARSDLDGYLVRVKGVLRRKVIPAAGPMAQGPEKDWVYYQIESPVVQRIERVEWPGLEVLPD
jgi:hypothetical protein